MKATTNSKGKGEQPAPADPQLELARAAELVDQLKRQEGEEIAAILALIRRLGRRELLVAIPDGERWKYEYTRQIARYKTRAGSTYVRVARLAPWGDGLTITAGPTQKYTAAVEGIEYNFLRARMGGFSGLARAIREALDEQLRVNSAGRDEALASLAAPLAASDAQPTTEEAQ